MPRQRLWLGILGALAGASLYSLVLLLGQGVLAERAALAIMVLAGVFFNALLALAGPIDIPRAALRAGLQALMVAGLVFWASFRFDGIEGLATSPPVLASVLVLTLIPLPFLLAEEAGSWRDYPLLFSAAWGVVMRATVAWVFVAILWAVIFLSHALLSLVGVDVITRIITFAPVPWLITGAGFGLAMAVALELADLVSAYLVLRLLRLLLPVVLAVVVVFLVAVALKGLAPLVGDFSIGAILMLMAIVAATLVTAAVDQTDSEATQAPSMRRATQALAVLLILPAALSAWAIWQRVAAHGWTPDRLFAATIAGLGLGYGAAYLQAVLRGPGWMQRIRQSNIGMALALIAISVLWLTPVLNPERIAAASQLARFRDAQTRLADLDLGAFDDWGRAGAAARVALETMATTDPDLAAALSGTASAEPAQPGPEDLAALRLALTQTLPLQPAGATAFRDRLLDLAAPADLKAWSQACATILPAAAGPGCVLIVADFLPLRDGNEAILVLDSPDSYLSYIGLATDGESLTFLDVVSASGELANFADGEKLIAALQSAMPTMRPVPRNEMDAPVGGALGLRP